MAKLVLVLALLAALCVDALAANVTLPSVQVTIQFDNTKREIEKQQPEILDELAKTLCKVPKNQVGVKGPINDQSTRLDSKSTVVYFCATSDFKATLKNCNSRWNRYQFNDEMEDRTSFPEIETEKIICDEKEYQTSIEVKAQG